MSLLRLDHVVQRFGATTAVDDVSVAVGPGEVVGLLGANGAGKTTTIRIALGLLRPTAGDVWLLGGTPSRDTRRELGYVPQSLGLWEDLTVAENLAFTARAFGVAPPPLPDDLAATADVPVGALSLGHRRRVAFLAALAHEPRLLVLDEPTSGVGPLERTRLWDQVHEVAEAGTGVLVTTHHMAEAEQCDRVVVMAAGRVVAEGPVDQLLAGRRTVTVRSSDWAATFTRLDRAFATVSLRGHDVRVPDADVEDVRAALDDPTADVQATGASFDEVFVSLAGRS